MSNPPNELTLTKEEQQTGKVYGDTFSQYDLAEFEKVMGPLRDRFAVNGIDPRIFAGKRCLDVGCGSGRGTLFMLQGGAQWVAAVDISEKLTESTRKWVRHFGFTNADVRLGSALDLPFADESFDFVWCNGVLHRTTDPDRGLQEIARVLKTGGQAFVYILGSGGVYWHFLDWARALVKDFDFDLAHRVMQWSGISKMDVACHADDWFNSYFRRYTLSDLERRFLDLGFSDIQRLAGLSPGDTITAMLDVPDQVKASLGEGALRFLMRKTAAPAGAFQLPDHEGRGSAHEEAESIRRYGAAYDRLTAQLEAFGHLTAVPAIWLVTLHAIDKRVRSLMASGRAFDDAAYREFLAETHSALDRLKTVL